jgi:hypothetical protein
MKDFGLWDSISPEAKLTLLIVRSLVSISSPEIIGEFLDREHLDWAKFNRIIISHEIWPSAHVFLKRYPHLVPLEELKLLEGYFCSHLLHLTSLQQEFLKILRCLRDKDITVLPLKGAYFLLDSQVYADKAYLRPMRDIDILVKKEGYLKAQSILESQGYQRELRGKKEEYWRNKNYHLAFTRKSQDGHNYMVEVHWALDYLRNKTLLPHLWKRIKTIEVEGKVFALLSPEDSIFSLALHQRRFGKMLLLKSACDVGLLLTKYADRLDWDYLMREAGEAQIRTTLYFVFLQAEALFDIRISSSVSRILGIPEQKKKLIQNFIIKDTFSRNSDLNSLYLKAHFLLYDSFREPVKSILNIPQEQFAKFYKLPAYTFKTNILYHFRWFNFIKGAIVILYKAAVNRIGDFFGRRK